MTHNPESADKKLVAWHTEAYNLIPDDACLICLTRKDVYLLGQALDQMRWETRWQVGENDTLPDIDFLASSLEVKLTDCIDYCQIIIDCIESRSDVRDAILTAIDGDSGVNGDSGRWLTDVIEPIPLCDQDVTYGYVVAMWGYINQNNKDFLQLLAEGANKAEQLSLLFSAVPIFNQLPFDEISLWVGKLGDYNLEAYNASITVVINEKIECDLFCIAVEKGCHLTFEDVWDYMVQEFGGFNFPTLGATFVELVSFMILGSYPNDRIVYLWTLVQLGIIFVGAEFLGINSMNSYAVHAQTGDPSNDWTLLCDPCGNGWSQLYLDGDGSPVVDGWVLNQGTYDSIVDKIDSTWNGTFTHSCIPNWTFTGTTTVTRVKHTGQLSKGSSNNAQIVQMWDDSASLWITLATTTPTAVGTVAYSVEFVGSQVFDVNDRLRLIASVWEDDPTGYSAHEKTILIEGEGVNPFV